MESQITIYEKPTCSTCRKASALLADLGLDFNKINYYVEPLSEAKLRELLSKMKMSPRQLLRKKEELYKQLGLGSSNHSDDEVIALMIKHPELMERPIVEIGSKAVLARPIDNIQSILC